MQRRLTGSNGVTMARKGGHSTPVPRWEKKTPTTFYKLNKVLYLKLKKLTNNQHNKVKIFKNFGIKEPNITRETIITDKMVINTLLVYAKTKEMPALEILYSFQYFPPNIFLQRMMVGNGH